MCFMQAFLADNVKNLQSIDVAHAWMTMDMWNISAILFCYTSLRTSWMLLEAMGLSLTQVKGIEPTISYSAEYSVEL